MTKFRLCIVGWQRFYINYDGAFSDNYIRRHTMSVYPFIEDTGLAHLVKMVTANSWYCFPPHILESVSRTSDKPLPLLNRNESVWSNLLFSKRTLQFTSVYHLLPSLPQKLLCPVSAVTALLLFVIVQSVFTTAFSAAFSTGPFLSSRSTSFLNSLLLFSYSLSSLQALPPVFDH